MVTDRETSRRRIDNLKRDGGVARLRTLTGTVAVGSLALTGVLSAAVAVILPGHSGHSPTSTVPGSHTASSQRSGPATPLQPAAQAPTNFGTTPTSPSSVQVVSGGS